MNSRVLGIVCAWLLACSSGGTVPQTQGAGSGVTSGQGSGGTGDGSGAGGVIASGALTSGSVSGSASGVTGSGTVVGSGSASGAGAGSSSGATGGSAGAPGGASSGGTDAAAGPDGVANDAPVGDEGSSGFPSDGALPEGAVNAVPAGYAGKPFKGVTQLIPGTIYARDYDTGGQGIAFNHPGGITCGDWPAGMPMYRMGPDCVGLSVTNAQKPDITTTGAPAVFGEIYVSYTGAGQWMKYTVKVTQSTTYVIGGHYATGGAPMNPVGVVISFSFTPTVSSGNVNVPTTANHNHESYHVWETLGLADNIAQVTIPAGVYVMTFAIVSSNGNFDTFTFTPKP